MISQILKSDCFFISTVLGSAKLLVASKFCDASMLFSFLLASFNWPILHGSNALTCILGQLVDLMLLCTGRHKIQLYSAYLTEKSVFLESFVRSIIGGGIKKFLDFKAFFIYRFLKIYKQSNFKVKSVQEACVKCFAVHIPYFLI